MLSAVARFEYRYQLRNPVFWAAFGIFVLFGFGLTASENVSLGSPGAVKENAPYTIGVALALFCLFYQFVTTSFVANAIVRDDTTGFGPIVRSTALTKNQFVMGRFLGGFAIALTGYLAVPLGMMVGVKMPWVDPETVGPNGPLPYLWHYLIIAVPNIFISCAFLLALATTFRSMMATYIGLIIFVMGYTITNVVVSAKPEWLETFAKFELLGIAAIQDLTRYWTTADLNNRLFPLEGNLLVNRLFVLGLGAAMLAATVWRFSMSERAPSKRQLKKIARREARETSLAAEEPAALQSPAIPFFGTATTWRQVRARLKVEIMQVLKSPGLIVILLLAIFNSLAVLLTSRTMYDTDTYPLTAGVIDTMRQNFALFLLMIAVFYGGELVWRERDRKVNEVIDASPVADWVMVLPKVVAIVVVLLLVNLAGMLTGMGFQIAKGVTGFSLGQYMGWYVLPSTFDMALIAMLAVFFQVLSPNKYVGWALMLVWFVGGIFLNNLGYANILYTYNGSPGEPLSDMNGNGGFQAGAWIARLYWGSFALLLMLIAHLIWPRGTVTALRPRLADMRKRLGAWPVGLGAAALVAMVGTGMVINRNIKQLNTYRTSDEVEQRRAEAERRYLKYENLPQPSVTDVRLNVALFPKERRMETSGVYRLRNDTGQPLSEMHVVTGNDDVAFPVLAIENAKQVRHDDDLGYRIFRFDRPLAPGATGVMRFTSRIHYRGFRNGAPATSLALNGSFVNNFSITPQIGINRNNALSDPTQRRRQGLTPQLRPAKLEDHNAARFNQIRTDWVMSDITLTTDADQVPVAPGERVSDSVANGRRTARFVSKAPIHNFFSLQSARYAIDRRDHRGISTEIYYHPAHRWNVPVMQRALAASLDYYQTSFGPYQFGHARIVEFPGYSSFAQAFAGTMPYSESIGFAADVTDAQAIDYVTYVTAHEVGHQYWAHQVVGADQQGSTLLTETLAQYSALMVMKKLYGPDKIRRFLKFELDSYLRSRKGEVIEELPLIRVENQGYIHYRKGSVVMYLLQERLGEAAVNRALARFIAAHKFKAAPYPRSVDLIAEFRREARTPEQQQLITDLFERITLYDMKVTAADTKADGKGGWVTTLTVNTRKYYAGGDGSEKQAPLKEAIEVGLFTARPGDGAFDRRNVISIQRMPVAGGVQKLTIRSKAKPAIVGIDPYNYYVDRNSDDNLFAVEG
jgi:ABC-2 type transport system permease protein